MTPLLPPWYEPAVEPDGRLTLAWRAFVERLIAQQRNHEATLPGYAATLPDIADQPDGRLFVLSTGPTLYQAQAGAWVAL